MELDRLQVRFLADLPAPVREHAGRTHHEKVGLPIVFQRHHRSNGLDRLAKAHLIAEDHTLLMKDIPHPPQLIAAQLAVETVQVDGVSLHRLGELLRKAVGGALLPEKIRVDLLDDRGIVDGVSGKILPCGLQIGTLCRPQCRKHRLCPLPVFTLPKPDQFLESCFGTLFVCLTGEKPAQTAGTGPQFRRPSGDLSAILLHKLCAVLLQWSRCSPDRNSPDDCRGFPGPGIGVQPQSDALLCLFLIVRCDSLDRTGAFGADAPHGCQPARRGSGGIGHRADAALPQCLDPQSQFVPIDLLDRDLPQQIQRLFVPISLHRRANYRLHLFDAADRPRQLRLKRRMLCDQLPGLRRRK